MTAMNDDDDDDDDGYNDDGRQQWRGWLRQGQ
jgi:hypothetical protein